MKEREFSRERKPDSLGLEVSRIVLNCRDSRRVVKVSSQDGRRNFKESLFSIFVDDLSPKVDVASMWGIFKTYGRVRDVFISTKRNNRRCSFAFVRFETWEKANKVANMGGSSKVDGESRNVEGKEKAIQGGQQRNLTFAEVVSGHQEKCVKEGQNVTVKIKSMTCDKEKNEEEWTAKCAIGVLKLFSKVAKGNSRLSSRDLWFHSSYLGDNKILWRFESQSEKEIFMSSRFLWDDCFDSIEECSEAFIPRASRDDGGQLIKLRKGDSGGVLLLKKKQGLSCGDTDHKPCGEGISAFSNSMKGSFLDESRYEISNMEANGREGTLAPNEYLSGPFLKEDGL
ncbi:hypothetical protein Dsin_026737 [Dipteronia sinensis]|uniref:RRM domain-containing protein n=1 Tax=Dipteronia sinensis TaxID=43782 RepID=A0AAD9ZY85_9ROSI|nr:hypothetical protein Dsin_026737 [Dipteronia sinensis]